MTIFTCQINRIKSSGSPSYRNSSAPLSSHRAIFPQAQPEMVYYCICIRCLPYRLTLGYPIFSGLRSPYIFFSLFVCFLECKEHTSIGYHVVKLTWEVVAGGLQDLHLLPVFPRSASLFADFPVISAET